MNKPSPDLVKAFFQWFRSGGRDALEDVYAETVTRAHLASLSDREFVDFFYQFACDGGRIQSGGRRTASRFKAAIERDMAAFRRFVLEPFANPFDEVRWLERTREYFGFGRGLATIYLNRVDKRRYAILNNKAVEAYTLFGVEVPAGERAEEYVAIRDAQRELIADYPEIENFYRADALAQFLVGEEAGRPWRDRLSGTEPAEKAPRYWIYAPGEQARLWDEFRRAGIMGIGWDALREDLSQHDAESDLEARYQAAYPDDGSDPDFAQISAFVRRVRPGDHVFAKQGRRTIVGYGRVVSPYFYDAGRDEYRHLHRMEWAKSGTWRVPESMTMLPMKTLTEVTDPDRVRDYLRLIGDGHGERPSGESGTPVDLPERPFTERTFSLLQELHETPTAKFYSDHLDEFRAVVETPFQLVMGGVAQRLSAAMRGALETERRIFSRIPKNDYGRGGAWDFYWGAFYPKGGKRIADPQLYLSINQDYVACGFYIGEYAKDSRMRFLANCRTHLAFLKQELSAPLSDQRFLFGDPAEERADRMAYADAPRMSWQDWLGAPDQHGTRVATVLRARDVVRTSGADLVSQVAGIFEKLFPLVQLATSSDPVAALSDPQDEDEDKAADEAYSLDACAADTYLPVAELQQWADAIERKRQAIFYGPPGTGKTFIAEKIARHLTSGSDGFWETLQFHPSYAYEDFIQGLRPQATAEGRLDYVMVPGRFKDFCSRARRRSGTCVLVIDEINRANLSRVFGELMYLLEYRDREIPLAGGETFRIPDNVRLVGTMNTADRSIALVDHALRRRFAFLSLYPNYGVLERYHEGNGFAPRGLVGVLHRVNAAIGDRHYAIGVSFFLRRSLREDIESIWRLEIEPYLEELFFGQPQKVESFVWSNVRGEILSD